MHLRRRLLVRQKKTSRIPNGLRSRNGLYPPLHEIIKRSFESLDRFEFIVLMCVTRLTRPVNLWDPESHLLQQTAIHQLFVPRSFHRWRLEISDDTSKDLRMCPNVSIVSCRSCVLELTHVSYHDSSQWKGRLHERALGIQHPFHFRPLRICKQWKARACSSSNKNQTKTDHKCHQISRCA